MEIIITGIHLELTEPIKIYVQDKISKVKKYVENISTAKVTLEKANKEGKTFIAKGILHVAQTDIISESEDYDLYAAIDILADKLERLVRKHKEKMKIRQ